jgi:hypothetical protein
LRASPRCRATEQEIEASLTGNYRREHVFALRQHLNLYDAYQAQITACDAEIESLLQQMASRQDDPKAPLPRARSRSPRSDNAPRFEIRTLLHRLTGADLTQIDSLGPYSALRLVSEIGTDMSRWPTEKHFTSWLTLAPRNKISGGKILSSKTQPSSNRAAVTLRMCAMSVGRTSTALGAYYRRLAYRVGKAKAITATARKIAILVYRVLRGDLDYSDPGAQAYEAQHRSRVLRNLRKRAKDLGFDLVNLETGELLPETVSQKVASGPAGTRPQARPGPELHGATHHRLEARSRPFMPPVQRSSRLAPVRCELLRVRRVPARSVAPARATRGIRGSRAHQLSPRVVARPEQSRRLGGVDRNMSLGRALSSATRRRRGEEDVRPPPCRRGEHAVVDDQRCRSS